MTMPNEHSVVHLVLRDHDKARALFDKLESLRDDELKEYFHTLRE